LPPLLMFQELIECGYARSYGGFKRFFREIYAERSDYSATLFLRNLVKTAPFKILAAQTDNGREWTNALFGQKRLEPTRFESELTTLGISYRRIRVGTPKHNGRVEQHKN
jgi:hypothetical protein